jgi:hypothetical protein
LVDPDGTPATKDGVQTQYKIPDDDPALTDSAQIIFNGDTLKPVESFSSEPAKFKQCIINGQNVQVGLPPNANDQLWYICDV